MRGSFEIDRRLDGLVAPPVYLRQAPNDEAAFAPIDIPLSNLAHTDPIDIPTIDPPIHMTMNRILPIAILLVFGAACQSRPMHPVVMSADGVEIAYSTAGVGEPALVFVHGWTLDRGFWDEQMHHFSRDRQTVALDLAGHGESGTERAEWTMAAFGHDVAAVVEAIGLERVVLIGHSMGGSVVLEASQLLEGRVAGIVLVDAFHDPEQPMPDEEREGILAAYRDDFEVSVGSMVRQYLFAPETDSLLAERIVTQMSTFDPSIGIPSVEALFLADYREMFQHIDVPIMAINSDLYATNEASMTRYGIAVRTMAGVGHFPMVEAPQRFNEILGEVALDWN